jgi:uncharacterized protein with ATP-grasp and redox domains
MQTINKLSDKIVSELYGNDHLDFRTEISNHEMMYDTNIFKVIDNFGQEKFEDLVIKKLNKLYNL